MYASDLSEGLEFIIYAGVYGALALPAILLSLILILIPNPITYIVGLSILGVASAIPVCYVVYMIVESPVKKIISSIETLYKNKGSISFTKVKSENSLHESDSVVSSVSEVDEEVVGDQKAWRKEDQNATSFKNPILANSHQDREESELSVVVTHSNSL